MPLPVDKFYVMYDREREQLFSYQFIDTIAPDLSRRLRAHEESCVISEMRHRTFEINHHVVFCPCCGRGIGNLRRLAPQCINGLERAHIEDVGVIGFGRFGSFFAAHLARWFDVTACDVVDRSAEAVALGVNWGTLEQAAAKDVVILAVPLNGMESVLQRLAPCLEGNSLVMDVCSVKQEPLRLMRKYLAPAELLGTHPLFGPSSVSGEFPLHQQKIVVCPVVAPSPRLQYLLSFLSDRLPLCLIEMSAVEHDQEMAKVQALTHFIGQALSTLGISDSRASTKAFDHLMETKRIVASNSRDLFDTVQKGNPFAAETRARFLEALVTVERGLLTA